MAWKSVKDMAGNTYNLYFQAFESECGPACVATIVRAVRNSLVDITQARQAVEKADVLRHITHAQDKHGVMQEVWTAQLNWTQDYSNMDALTQALSSLQVNSAYTLKGLGTNLGARMKQRTSRARPGIVNVQWKNGGGHFVVVAGSVAGAYGDKVIILDPHYGLQHVPMNMLPTYKPVAGPSVHTGDSGEGTFYPWLITTN